MAVAPGCTSPGLCDVFAIRRFPAENTAFTVCFQCFQCLRLFKLSFQCVCAVCVECRVVLIPLNRVLHPPSFPPVFRSVLCFVFFDGRPGGVAADSRWRRRRPTVCCGQCLPPVSLHHNHVLLLCCCFVCMVQDVATGTQPAAAASAATGTGTGAGAGAGTGAGAGAGAGVGGGADPLADYDMERSVEGEVEAGGEEDVMQLRRVAVLPFCVHDVDAMHVLFNRHDASILFQREAVPAAVAGVEAVFRTILRQAVACAAARTAAGAEREGADAPPLSHTVLESDVAAALSGDVLAPLCAAVPALKAEVLELLRAVPVGQASAASPAAAQADFVQRADRIAGLFGYRSPACSAAHVVRLLDTVHPMMSMTPGATAVLMAVARCLFTTALGRYVRLSCFVMSSVCVCVCVCVCARARCFADFNDATTTTGFAPRVQAWRTVQLVV